LALQDLALRHYQWMSRLVARVAQALGLPREEVGDAQQGAFLVLVRVVKLFDSRRGGEGRTADFRAFLGLKLTSYVRDFARQWRRREAHLDRSTEAQRVLQDGSDEGASACHRPWATAAAEDPALAAEGCDLLQRLKEALSWLGAADRELLDGWAAGLSLHVLAERVGVSYRQVRYRLSQLLSWLKQRLNGHAC
jgi:RNA polymerase sigma factor (sigma-70 family)